MTALASSVQAASGGPLRAPEPLEDAMGRPLRDLRISVTDRCNFRCSYCLPADAGEPRLIARDRLLSFEQIARVAEAAADLGVSKVRLTGGEPLLRRGLPALVAMLAGLRGVGELALTTNGWLLDHLAGPLADAGLRRATVSLDSLDPDTFARISGVGASPERVVAGIDAALATGLRPVKLNAVIRRGVNDAGVVELAAFARDRGLELRLIEYMDVGQAGRWDPAEVVPAAAMLAAVDAAYPLAAEEEPADGSVARRYRYADGAGALGVITAVSRPFCGGCTRLRLTADGNIYTCLFAEWGADLRPLLQPGADPRLLGEAMLTTWGSRLDRYSETRASARPGRRSVEMYRIGG